VHSAMPMAQALRLCPQAIVVEPRMERYSQVSRQVMEILKSFSSDVHQISIDEAFFGYEREPFDCSGFPVRREDCSRSG